MKVIGCDPGLATFGVVEAALAKNIEDVVFVRAACFFSTPCKELSKAQNLISRTEELAGNLSYFVDRGDYADVYAVCTEGHSYPRFTQAAVLLGAGNGVLGARLDDWQPHVIFCEQPQAIRKAVLGVGVGKTPPEADVHAFLLARYPELADMMKPLRKAARPHILDAAAAVVAAYKLGRLDP